MIQEVREHLNEMLANKHIRPSSSPWAFPAVLARKKDNTLRFCVDYRELNSRTIRDAYALPRIDETLDALSGATLFSCLDLRGGYWQVDLEEEAKEKKRIHSWKSRLLRVQCDAVRPHFNASWRDVCLIYSIESVLSI